MRPKKIELHELPYTEIVKTGTIKLDASLFSFILSVKCHMWPVSEFLQASHRIIKDRMEKTVKVRRFMNNLL